MTAKTILFLAQPQAVSSIFPQLRDAGIEAGLADSLAGALNFVRKTPPLLVFTRPSLPGYSARDLLATARDIEGFPPVVLFTDRGSADEARQFLELGARDYWLEPLLWDKIRAVLPDSRVQEPGSRPGPDGRPEGLAAGPGRPRPAPPKGADAFHILGRHQAMLRVLALARQVARSKATVLISGESGTGKEMFARFLHLHSDRADKPFIAINCAALPEHLLESELFGHEKGAFTGAISRKPGKFELADTGTLLLDEVSEMDIGLQAKLLRVLQESEFDRVGGVETVRVDVRVLATTNRKLEEAVAEGKFRQDLYYRLNVIPLRLPALRERGDDVMLLARAFVDSFCRTYGLPPLAFSPEAEAWLSAYDWPGNVRELHNLMERAVLLAGRGPIEKRHFLIEGMEEPDWTSESWAGADQPDALPGTHPDARGGLGARGARGGCPEEPVSYELVPASAEDLAAGGRAGEGIMPLDEMEKRLILKSLDHTSGNRTQAAELLGISVRTLRNKLNEYREQGLVIP